MGLKANLTAGEIVEQLIHARTVAPVRNVVFMGMGEVSATLGLTFQRLSFSFSCFVPAFLHPTAPEDVCKVVRPVQSQMLLFISRISLLPLHSPSTTTRPSGLISITIMIKYMI